MLASVHSCRRGQLHNGDATLGIKDRGLGTKSFPLVSVGDRGLGSCLRSYDGLMRLGSHVVKIYGGGSQGPGVWR